MSDRDQAGLGRHSHGIEYQNIHVGGEAKVIPENTYNNSKSPSIISPANRSVQANLGTSDTGQKIPLILDLPVL